ncbi:hypothetical protein [Nesterenkonia xinjiangensis]|uniref:Uncharacterized protein n=1 Tax=Nesterenkonia xinjiangensis TaxID=225327 RepID=A0A7Z0GLJ5_9MICC|nr:hypothetical protein [Nesterenkonia xinjiangensis]NYJ78210.1 hypothetical protein [Nesterenkonia xinjiangensis]
MNIQSRFHRYVATVALTVPGLSAAVLLKDPYVLLVPAFTMIIASVLLQLFMVSAVREEVDY